MRDGTYVVGHVLGVGGFGITYAGVDLTAARQVAIKELFPQGCQRVGLRVAPGPTLPAATLAAARARFAHEARVAAAFEHPSIVRVLGWFEENDTGYLVTERLDGCTLHDRIDRDGPLPLSAALPVAARLADALEAVHAAGFVHRDVKPDNVFLTDDGRVVLLDFGTAKIQAAEALPVTGLVSPGYAPPEQYLPSHVLDARGDVYGLGATLYHALTGAPPSDAPARGAGAALIDPRTLAPDLPPHVAEAMLSALSLDPTQRPTSVTSFLARLAPSAPPLPATASTHLTEDTTAPRFLLPRGLLKGHRGMVRGVDITPDSRFVISGAEDRTVRLWCAVSLEPQGVLAETGDWVSGLQVSPDGRFATVASHDRSVRLIDLETRTVTATLRCPSAALGVVWSPDGHLIAATLLDGRIVLWGEDGVERGQMQVGREPVRGLAFSPDSARLASGSGSDGCVRLWDLTTRQESAVAENGSGSIRSLAWSPDGACIAATASDRIIRLYDATRMREIGRLEGHQGRVNAVAFHPTRPLLASGGADKSIRLWNLQDGACVQTVTLHTGEVLCLAWSRDGRLLASGSQDDRVGLLEVAP